LVWYEQDKVAYYNNSVKYNEFVLDSSKFSSIIGFILEEKGLGLIVTAADSNPFSTQIVYTFDLATGERKSKYALPSTDVVKLNDTLALLVVNEFVSTNITVFDFSTNKPVKSTLPKIGNLDYVVPFGEDGYAALSKDGKLYIIDATDDSYTQVDFNNFGNASLKSNTMDSFTLSTSNDGFELKLHYKKKQGELQIEEVEL